MLATQNIPCFPTLQWKYRIYAIRTMGKSSITSIYPWGPAWKRTNLSKKSFYQLIVASKMLASCKKIKVDHQWISAFHEGPTRNSNVAGWRRNATVSISIHFVIFDINEDSEATHPDLTTFGESKRVLKEITLGNGMCIGRKHTILQFEVLGSQHKTAAFGQFLDWSYMETIDGNTAGGFVDMAKLHENNCTKANIRIFCDLSGLELAYFFLFL